MALPAPLLPKIILDSSVLRSAGWRSAAIASLFELARNGQIEVIIPQMAYDERRTQWREEYSKKIKESIRQIKSARQDPLLDKDVSDALDAAVAKLETIADAESTSIRLTEIYFGNGAKVEATLPGDGSTVMASYLAGAPPFSDVKARKDIPDAYIYEAVKRHADEKYPANFVTGDENLAAAVREIPGITVFTDLSELMTGPVIVGALETVALSERWDEYFGEISDEWFEETAREFVEDHYIGFLERIHIRDRSIPSDGHEASMNLFYDVEDFQTSLVTHFGNGWVQIECEFECEVNLSFMVYKNDAFDLPDWVTVSYGDPEEDHYFDAEGGRRIAVKLVLAAKMHIDSDGDPTIENIELSEPPKVELVD